MAKLYPPYIEGKIPGQSGTVLDVPFRLNRNVGIKEIGCVIARIKTVSTNNWLGTVPVIDESKRTEILRNGYVNFSASNSTDYVAHIDITELNQELVVGQFYKIQLAFYDAVTDTTGYFSSVGIFKYSTLPIVTMPGLSKESMASNIYNYTGLYSQKDQDITEKIYSYEFIIRNMTTGEIVETSGERVHDSSKDDSPYESVDEYTIESDLNHIYNYTIEYAVRTMNGLTSSSGRMRISSSDVLENPLSSSKLIAHNDFENGRIIIKATDVPKDYMSQNRLGYVISRASADTNYTIWQDVVKFTVAAMSPFPTEFGEDYTVEQGKKYKYALQLFQSSGLRTKRLISDEVYADFEDIFLYDGERQLKIRYNPKVTSFKTTTLETKIDTLGGKYPFVFRNGNVAYKEFPLSGLISHLMDKDEQFMSNIELGFTEQNIQRDGPSKGEYTQVNTRSTRPDAENFYAERIFKLFILNWLNNGKIKLFRSPAEGNYIVRLINISLSPMEQVSRLIHTFNSTVYEIDDYNYTNLVKYNFIAKEKDFNDRLLVYYTLPISELKKEGYISKAFNITGGAQKLEIREAKPGTIFAIKFQHEVGEQSIMIGTSGTYLVPIHESPVDYIRITSDAYHTSGYIDYGVYSDSLVEDFTPVRNIIFTDKGFQYTSYKYESEVLYNHKDVKYDIDYIYSLHFTTREKIVIYKNNNQYYLDEECTVPCGFSNDAVYQVNGTNNYICGKTLGNCSNNLNYKYSIIYKDGHKETFDLEGPKDITIKGLKGIDKIIIGNGLILDCYYQATEYIYGIESDDPEVKLLKEQWLHLIDTFGTTSAEAANAYKAFIKLLTSKLEE